MNIVWSPEAIEDLNSLRAYISENDPPAARRAVLHILHSIEQLLPDNPKMGRSGRVPGTRELVIPKTPFIVPYRFSDFARLPGRAPLARELLAPQTVSSIRIALLFGRRSRGQRG